MEYEKMLQLDLEYDVLKKGFYEYVLFNEPKDIWIEDIEKAEANWL